MIQFLIGAFVLALLFGALRLFVRSDSAALIKAGIGLAGVLCVVACVLLIASERLAWAALPIAVLAIGFFIRFFRKQPKS